MHMNRVFFALMFGLAKYFKFSHIVCMTFIPFSLDCWKQYYTMIISYSIILRYASLSLSLILQRSAITILTVKFFITPPTLIVCSIFKVRKM